MRKDWFYRFVGEYQDILTLAMNALSRDEYELLRDSYREQNTLMSEHQHKRLSTIAAKLARTVLINGCDIQEIELALTNLWICMDADKYRLNWRRFQKENGIDKLMEKYKGGAANGDQG